MDLQDIDPKLLKIVALAKNGVGGEKAQAIRIVKRICARDGLNFDEVMDGKDQPQKREPEFKIVSKDEVQVAIQVAARFASTPEYPDVRGGRFRGYKLGYVEYTATTARHIETVNAIEIYLAAYRKEKKNIAKALQQAFVINHGLYSQFREDRDEERPAPTAEQLKEQERAIRLTGALSEDVDLVKRIGSVKQ